MRLQDNVLSAAGRRDGGGAWPAGNGAVGWGLFLGGRGGRGARGGAVGAGRRDGGGDGAVVVR